MGIPTVPRKSEADYLTRTLETLLQELPADSTDPLYAKVRVLVMNNRPGKHTVFYAVSLRQLRTALSVWVSGQRSKACLPSTHRSSPHMRHLPQWATEEMVKVPQSPQPGSLVEGAPEACVRGGAFVAMPAACRCPWWKPWVTFKVCKALMFVSLQARTNHDCAAGQRRLSLWRTLGCDTHYNLGTFQGPNRMLRPNEAKVSQQLWPDEAAGMQVKERVRSGPKSDPFVAKARVYLAMVDNPGTLPDPTPDMPDPDDLNNPTNRPGR